MDGPRLEAFYCSAMTDQSSKSTAFALLGFTVLVWGVAPAFIRSFSLAAGPADALVIRTIAVGILLPLPAALFRWLYRGA